MNKKQKQRFSEDLLSKGFIPIPNFLIVYQEEPGLTDSLLMFIIKILRYSDDWIIQDSKVFPKFNTETLRRKRKQIKDLELLKTIDHTIRNSDGTFRCTGIKYDFSPLENKLLELHKIHRLDISVDSPLQNDRVGSTKRQGHYNTNTLKKTSTLKKTTTTSSSPTSSVEEKKDSKQQLINECIEIHRSQFIQCMGFDPPDPTDKDIQWLSSLYQQNELIPFTKYLTVMAEHVDDQRQIGKWTDKRTGNDFIPLLSFWRSVHFRRKHLENIWREEDERRRDIEKLEQWFKKKKEESIKEIEKLLGSIDKELFFQWLKETKNEWRFEENKDDIYTVKRLVKQYQEQISEFQKDELSLSNKEIEEMIKEMDSHYYQDHLE